MVDPVRLGVFGLQGAMDRLRRAADDVRACAGVGECLLWIVALDETREAETGDPSLYRLTRDADWNGQLLPPLRWARNTVAHELRGLAKLVPVFRLDVSRLDGPAVLADSAEDTHQLFWPYLDSVGRLRPPASKARRDRWEEGRAAYVHRLEGQRVLPTLDRAAHFLTEGPTDARPS